MNKEVLRKTILNHYEMFTNKDIGVVRDYLTEFKKEIDNPLTIVITGHRRVGKSTLLLQIAKKYYKNNFYYLDFSDPSLKNLDVSDYEPLYELFLKEFGLKKAFFFDEIQGKPEWNSFVNILRERKHKCFVTGSNSEMLSSEISTYLTGRHKDKIIFPFSFKEFLNYKTIDTNLLTTTNTSKILKYFDIYLEEGGFPENIIFNQPEILKDIYKDIITRDIISRWNIQNISDIEDLAYYLLSNTTNEFTYSSLNKYLKIKDPKTIQKYVKYICKTYFLFELSQFDYSLKKQRKKKKKIYCIDNGFLTNVGYAFSIGKSRYLENLIFIELKRRNKEVYFFRNAKNQECDFLVVDKKKVMSAIQVCYDLKNIDTEEREINGLIFALKEYRLNTGIIITYNTSKTIKKDKFNIKFIPAYKWLLE
jgi:predicted AAA+ superfamily ATPase